MVAIGEAQEVERRFRDALPHLKTEQAETLLGSLGEIEVKELKSAHNGLVMVSAIDAFDERFHLGEALATVAEIECAGVRGHATVLGDDPCKAVLAAIVNACCRSPEWAELLAPFQKELDACCATVEAGKRIEAQVVASTKVRFDRMAPERG